MGGGGVSRTTLFCSSNVDSGFGIAVWPAHGLRSVGFERGSANNVALLYWGLGGCFFVVSWLLEDARSLLSGHPPPSYYG